MTRKNYRVNDIDCTIEVEITTRKDILGYLDTYLDNMQYDWFDGGDESFRILYNDGTTDSISIEDYDNHKIRRTNISAMVYDNPCTSMVYGNYTVNEYGVVNPSFEMEIATENITEL